MFGGAKRKAQGTVASQTNKRLLTVTVVEARNIIGADSRRGTSDSYVQCALLDVGERPVKNETFTTQKVNGTVNPTFGQSFAFGKVYDLDTTGELPSLKLSLFHKGSFAVSEEPLGVVAILLYDLDPNGGVTDMWYPIKKDGRMDTVSGELHLKLAFSRAPTRTDGDDIESGLTGDPMLEENVDPDAEDVEPNELVINVIQAKNLEMMDKNLFSAGGSSDPFVRIRIPKFDDKVTGYIAKTVTPVWNEKIVYPHMHDRSATVQVSVYDHNNVGLKKFMGRVQIPIYEYYDKKPRKSWYKLQAKDQNDGKERGEIELSIIWRWSSEVAEAERKKEAADKKSVLKGLERGLLRAANSIAGNIDDDDMDVAEMGGGGGDNNQLQETDEQKEARKKEEEEKMKDLANIDIKSGDYVVQVHIIEARDLAAENLDGTSDPVVFIEVFDQKQNTSTKSGCTSCVFDELLIFNFRNLDKEAFQDGLVRIICRDHNANPLGKQKMIGAVTYDTSAIYTRNKEHELYREWVALVDDEDSDDIGVQGYLKISIQIIGPGEKQVVHDEEADIAKEIAAETAAGGDVGSMCLTVPSIKKDWKFLVCSVYRCEALPVMDAKLGVGYVKVSSAGTDAFAQVSIGGSKPSRTKAVTVKGDNRLAINPILNYELWVPVSVPSSTSQIKFQIFDEDEFKNDLIGQVYENFTAIAKTYNQSLDIKWYNLYGKPEFHTEKITVTGLAKGGVNLAKKAQRSLMKEINYDVLYNNIPDKASTFKGRVLARFRIASQRPAKYDLPEMKPFKLKIPSTMKIKEPPSADYVLKAMIVVGNQMPAFQEINVGAALTAATGQGAVKQDLRVKVTIGAIELTSQPAKTENHTCRWNETLVSEPIKLPVDLKQMPDIIIYLLKEDNRPVCFHRLKASHLNEEGDLVCIGFDRPAEWFLFQEDKVVNALKEHEFPGTVLIKLGFGRLEEERAPSNRRAWDDALDDAKTTTACQVRVLLYQGRDIPPLDSNGLCDPFVKIGFQTKKTKSAVQKKTLFPEFYETFVFDDCNIPDKNNFLYAPQVILRVFDQDIIEDQLIGTCTISLTKAHVTENPDADLPDPVWYDLFFETPGDAQGKLLVNLQIIKTMNNPYRDRLRGPNGEPRSILPELKDAYIDITAVGIRDMAPFNFMPMNSPFLEVELSSSRTGNKYLEATAPSKRPEPANPNFLQQIMLKCKLPVNSLYATPLQLRARDHRLGGWSKPVVGVGAVPLMTKLPWCENTYIPPQTNIFKREEQKVEIVDDKELAEHSGLDEAGIEAMKMERQRIEELAEDDLVALQEPAEMNKLLQKRLRTEDTGAGVFGALNHIQIDGKRKKTGANVFVDPDWSQDDGDQPPAWSINRRKLPEELEMEYKTTPFEVYELSRGKRNGLLGSTFKITGIFKGLIRVIEDKDETPLLPKELLDTLMKPSGYKVRLYILKGHGISPMDRDIFGKPSNSDPYLLVKLGKDKFDDRQNAAEDAVDVDFYKMIPFDANLPGTSRLNISVMNRKDFRSDQVIGSTTIDLEDRWFDPRWQVEGKENQRLPSDLKDNQSLKPRWSTLPIERRSLYSKASKAPMGVVECWVDIMTPEVAAAFEPDDVSLPPKQIFEVRVVIWKSKNVPAMDSLEGMSDLFLKVWPEGSPIQETDTHWRCKKGKASWNYRLLFDVELGHSTKAMKFPYLHLQLWDRDLLKWNDCAGEVVINLGRYYKKAFKRGITLKLFETKQGAQAKREKKKLDGKEDAKQVEIVDNGEDIPPEEKDEPKPPMAQDSEMNSLVSPDPLSVTNPINGGVHESKHEEVDSDDDDEHDDLGVGAVPSNQQIAMSKMGASTQIEVKGNVKLVKPGQKPPKEVKKSWWPWAKEPEPEEEEVPLLEGDLQKTDEEKKKEEEDEEVRTFVSTVKNLTGLWEDDPDDSTWAHFEQHDHNTGKATPMGSVCYSVQIWPKEKALLFPAGSARTEPNTNPFLPPPTGRLKFSWNPFVMGSALCGPKLCSICFCILLCGVFVVLMIFCQPFLNLVINLIFFG